MNADINHRDTETQRSETVKMEFTMPFTKRECASLAQDFMVFIEIAQAQTKARRMERGEPCD